MITLNLSGKIDTRSIAIYSAIDRATRELAISYVVVGASARDLVLHYGYDARIKRATADIDFGIQVPDWETFETLRLKLIECGFSETRTQHRLLYEGFIVDLVPFGAIQDESAKIVWPSNGDVVMNVLGFQEAIENAASITIQDNPKITVPVVTPPGLSLLKIICWTDRDSDLRNKDAKDLLFLFRTYEEIPAICESIYNYPEVMEEFDWNITLGCTYKLGLDVAAISSDKTNEYLGRIEDNQIDKRPTELLIEDMCENIEDEFELNKQLLSAYFRGINHK